MSNEEIGFLATLIFGISYAIRIVMSTVAQLLLTRIFWMLAEKPVVGDENESNADRTSIYETVEVEEFDEDAEI